VLVNALAIAGVVIGAWVAFNYATIGRPLPTTFYAKSGSGVMRAIEQRDGAMARRTFEVYGPRAVTNFAIILREQLGWAAWLTPVGLLYCVVGVRRRAAAAFLALVLIGAPFAMGLTAPQRLKPSNERYAPHLIVLAAVLAAVGAAPICRAAARDRRLLAATAVALPAVLVYSAATHPEFGAFYFARSVKNIQELHVRLGEWIRTHIPAGAVVATNDVGAIAYFGEHRILDIEGLVSPESLAFRGPGRGLKVVETFRPDYLAIFPHWYPEIAALPDRFRPVHRVMIGDNYISAGGEFVVLQSPWARVPLLPPAPSTGAASTTAASAIAPSD
jgi:arabinofuranosyltransferase